MHAPPPFQMTVRRFGVWQGGLSLLVGTAAVVLGVWAKQAMVWAPVWLWISLGFFVLSSSASLAHAWRLKPMRLRWDTQRWFLAGPEAIAEEPTAGRLVVAIDLGAWMLLHFVPDDAGMLRRGTWLPVQRRGHEAEWHALRATVYCVRPLASPVAAPF